MKRVLKVKQCLDCEAIIQVNRAVIRCEKCQTKYRKDRDAKLHRDRKNGIPSETKPEYVNCRKCGTQRKRGQGIRCKPCTRLRQLDWDRIGENRIKGCEYSAAIRAARTERDKEVARDRKRTKFDIPLDGARKCLGCGCEIELKYMSRRCRPCYAIKKSKGRREVSRRRRSAEKMTLGSFTEDEWEKIVERQRSKCAECRKKKPLQRDHIVPVSLGGTSYAYNIQGLCQPCNLMKSNKITTNCWSLFDAAPGTIFSVPSLRVRVNVPSDVVAQIVEAHSSFKLKSEVAREFGVTIGFVRERWKNLPPRPLNLRYLELVTVSSAFDQ